MKRARWKLINVAISFVVPSVLIAWWFWLYHAKAQSLTVVASPVQVAETLFRDRYELLTNTLLSLSRLIKGVLLGALLGTASGITLARVKPLRLLFMPTFKVLASIPFLILIPFFLMLFGMDDGFRIAVVTASTFLLVNGCAFREIRQLNPDYIELGLIYEKSRISIVTEILLPASLPAIIEALRLSLLFGWLAVALAENASAELPCGGLGYYIIRAKAQGQYPEMFAGSIILGLFAFSLDCIVARIQFHCSKWCDSHEAKEDGRG